MTNQQIIDKYLSEFHEVHGIKVPIELNPYIHRMIEDAKNSDNRDEFIKFISWVGDGFDFEKHAEKIVDEYLNEFGK